MERRKKITGYVINLDRMLGEGSFGKVFVGNEDVTNDVVAIKILDKQKSTHALTQSIKTSTTRTFSFRR